MPLEYAQTEIKAGHLVQVLDIPWPARFAYYIVTHAKTQQREEIRLFIEWLLEQTENTRMGSQQPN